MKLDYRTPRGNTLSEYGLAFGLVVVLSVVALQTLGGSLSFSLNSVSRERPTMMKMASMDFSGAASAKNGGQAPQNAASLGGAGRNIVSVDPATGDLIIHTGYNGMGTNATSIDGSINSIGMGGTSNLLSDQLALLATQLQNISPAQAQLLRDLANKGHKIADIEKTLEAAARQDGAINNPITYDGVTYANADALALTIGLYTATGVPYNSNGYMQSFGDTLKQIQNSGLLNDPAVKQIVTPISSNIVNIADGTENILSTRPDTAQADLTQNPASTVTNSGSKVICVTGNGTDNTQVCL